LRVWRGHSSRVSVLSVGVVRRSVEISEHPSVVSLNNILRDVGTASILRESELRGILIGNSRTGHNNNSLITSVDITLTIGTSSDSGSSIVHSHKDGLFHIRRAVLRSASQVVRCTQSETTIAQRVEDIVCHIAVQASQHICGCVDRKSAVGTSASEGIHRFLSEWRGHSRRVSVLSAGVVGGGIGQIVEHPSVVGTNDVLRDVGAASILSESELSRIRARKSGIGHDKNSLITGVDVALTVGTGSDSGARNSSLRAIGIGHRHKARLLHIGGSFRRTAGDVVGFTQHKRIVAQRIEDIV